MFDDYRKSQLWRFQIISVIILIHIYCVYIYMRTEKKSLLILNDKYPFFESLINNENFEFYKHRITYEFARSKSDRHSF